ncbi:MAG: hypothetical protein ACI8SE_000525 [Bacteroidia bacterium]|jgi:hypothetical protein
MKVLNIFVIVSTVLILASCKSKSKSSNLESTSISVKIEYIEQYCGGAQPTDDLMEEMSVAKPYSNRPIYISKFINMNTFTDEKKLVLDKGGIGSIDLDSGLYVISFYELAKLGVPPPTEKPKLENQVENPEPNPEMDKEARKADCELRWKRMSAFPFKVVHGKTAYEFPMIKECNPCEEPRP